MPTAIVVATVIGIVARKLWFAARRQTPLVAGDCEPARFLENAVSVGISTTIAITAADLAYVRNCGPWRALLARWLRSGARIRYLISSRDAEGEAMLAKLASAGSIELLVVKEEARGSDIARAMGEYHFAAFDRPDQLWLEGFHKAGADVAKDCEFVTDASDDPRWSARREDFEELASKADVIDLAGGEK